jgi:hypothetical protein
MPGVGYRPSAVRRTYDLDRDRESAPLPDPQGLG